MLAHAECGINSLVLGSGEGLLGNEDTIEELTLILLADLADLGDTGARLGKEGVVNSVEDELVLHVLGEEDGAAGVELDEVASLATEEVLDLDLLLVLGDDGGDGEMRMHQSHLVAEALNSLDIWGRLDYNFNHKTHQKLPNAVFRRAKQFLTVLDE